MKKLVMIGLTAALLVTGGCIMLKPSVRKIVVSRLEAKAKAEGMDISRELIESCYDQLVVSEANQAVAEQLLNNASASNWVAEQLEASLPQIRDAD